MYRQVGGDIINMSALPEAKLAREAELSYVLIATGRFSTLTQPPIMMRGVTRPKP